MNEGLNNIFFGINIFSMKAVITDIEKKEIARIKILNPKIGGNEIAKKIGRSRPTVYRAMKTEQYKKFLDSERQKIDRVRLKNLLQVEESLASDIPQMNAFTKIGYSKTAYEQVFGLVGSSVQGVSFNGETVNVQVVRGNIKPNPNE